jgi:2-oxoglutarate dehydrogenase E2 component (dihydrolipoamide succinyltransferase)
VLVTLETDKVSNELEATQDGTLNILVSAGEEVAIGTVIALIEEGAPSEAATSEPAPTEEPGKKPEPAAPKREAQESPTQQVGESIEIKVPAAGESITSASLASWRKKDGDSVVEGEVLVLLETDKVSNELEAPATGRLKIIVPEGTEVPVGAVIAKIETGAAAEASKESKPQPESPPPAPTSPKKETPSPAVPAAAPRKPDFTAPAKPVEREVSSEPVSDGRTTRRKMSMLRRKIATPSGQRPADRRHPHHLQRGGHVRRDGPAQGGAGRFVKKHGVKLGFMSFFVKAVTQALKDVPGSTPHRRQ